MKQIFISIDQFFNTVVWIPGDGFGFADETLSARSWRLREQSRVWRVIDALFFWDRDHCRQSYQSEVDRRQLPRHYQSTPRSS